MMKSRNLTVLRALAVAVFLLGWAGTGESQAAREVVAQDGEPAPTALVDSDSSRIASIEKQVQALIGQVRQVSERVKTPSAEEKVREAVDAYSASFKALRESAGVACRRLKGRFSVHVDAANKVSLTCAW